MSLLEQWNDLLDSELVSWEAGIPLYAPEFPNHIGTCVGHYEDVAVMAWPDSINWGKYDPEIGNDIVPDFTSPLMVGYLAGQARKLWGRPAMCVKPLDWKSRQTEGLKWKVDCDSIGEEPPETLSFVLRAEQEMFDSEVEAWLHAIRYSPRPLPCSIREF